MSLHVIREESAWEPLFARLTERLVEVISLEETLDVMLEAIVPAFADWMSVYLERPEGGGFEVIAMRHWDEQRMPLVRELLGTSFATGQQCDGDAVLRTGRSITLLAGVSRRTAPPRDLAALRRAFASARIALGDRRPVSPRR